MNVPQHWRLRGQRMRLEGSVCPICGCKSFPPRHYCPQCIQSLETRAARFENFAGFAIECSPTSNGIQAEIALPMKAITREVAV